MAERSFPTTLFVIVAVLIAFGVVALAAVSGYWMGTRATPGDPMAGRNGEAVAGQPLPSHPGPAPWVALETGPAADWEALAGEVALASEAGFHRFLLPVGLPWGAGAIEPVWDHVRTLDPNARFVLRVSAMPPEAWLASHPDAAAVLEEAPQAWPSLASESWRAAAAEELAGLAKAVGDAPVDGIVLEGLELGRWRVPGRDTSEAALAGFRDWLRQRYADDEALRAAWGDSRVTLVTARIPAKPASQGSQGSQTFLPPAERAVQADYRRYQAEVTADAIRALAIAWQEEAGGETAAYASYGDTFEHLANEGGHLGLSALLYSEVSGFLAPVSYHDRGLGGVGGFAGPVDSVRRAGKAWYIIDDTRTGISRDPATGAIETLAGLRLQDVRQVHARNFGAALAHDAGMIWADPGGSGRLLDASLWQNFAAMRNAQAGFLSRQAEGRGEVTLSVVVDEASRFLMASETLNRQLLLEARDAAFCAGVPVQCVLLDDVVAGDAPGTPVYLFLNAFHLEEDRRERLHARLARESAAAIWVYAPGYVADDASVHNVAATTQFEVSLLDADARAGSRYALDSRLLEPGRPFGRVQPVTPLFRIEGGDSEEVTVLARYAESDAVSAAIRFTDDDWASVYIAEPTVTPALLRQILLILTHHVYLDEPRRGKKDAAWFRDGLIALHARASGAGGKRLVMQTPVDLQGLLDERLGWFETDVVDVNVRLGETWLLEITGRYDVPLPEDGPVPES